MKIVEEASEKTGIPIRFTAVKQDLDVYKRQILFTY